MESPLLFSTAIERGCLFNILLHDYKDEAALAKRFRSANDGSTLISYAEGIRGNLGFLYLEWLRLDERERERIKIRLHNNFLSVSSWGFGDYFIVGNYLHGKSAVQGTQLKVDRDVQGAQSGFYADLEQDFSSHWRMAQNQSLSRHW